MAAATLATAPTAEVPTLQYVAGLPAPDMSMPALEPVDNRDQYRQRPKTEMEEAQWYSPDEPDAIVEPQQVHLRSIHSKQASQVIFSNKSAYRVRALWLDFAGHEVVYSVLEPNSTKRYHTYCTHPWIVREVQSGTRMMLSGRPAVVGTTTEQTVEVQAPPELTWSLSTHGCFPADYKSSVKSLLLAHKKLEPFAAATHGPASPSVLAERSIFASPSKRRALASPSTCSTGSGCGSSPMSPRGRLTMPRLEAPTELSCSSPRAATVSAGGRLPPLLPPLSPARAGASGVTATFTTASLPATPHGAAGGESTTSFSFSSEAAFFTAKLTLSSPKRAMLHSTVDIQVTSAPASGGGVTTVNCSTTTTGVSAVQPAAAEEAPAGPSPMLLDGLLPVRPAGNRSSTGKALSSSGKKGGLFSLLKVCTAPATRSPLSSLNVFKNMLNKSGSSKHHSTAAPGSSSSSSSGRSAMEVDQPTAAAGTTTTFKLEVQHHQDSAAAPAAVLCVPEAEAEDCCWPPLDTHLGNLPSHLLVYVAELAAPVCYQTLAQCPKGRPDIKPSMMACPPEAEAPAGDDAQQDQDQDDDQPPALL